jgi:carbon-monoxide dehydrogenase large subunit
MKFAVGQPVRRVEDTRLITGKGKFTDDLKLPNTAHGIFVRSPYAHANISSINFEEALKMPGVVDIYTGERLKSEGLKHMSV